MIRRRLQLLAHAARAALLLGCAAAGATALLWSCWPERVDAFGRWVHRKLHGVAWARWHAADAAQARGDAAAMRAELEALADDLAGVQALDQQRWLAVQTLERLIDLANAERDAAAAIRYARQLHAIDPRSHVQILRLADCLAADPAGRGEAIALLAAAAQQTPDSGRIVELLVRLRLDAGDLAGARGALEAALAWPPAAWWSVRWASGSGDAAVRTAGFQPRLEADGRIVATFAIVDPIETLTLLPPSGASLQLDALAWTIRGERDGTARPLPLRDRRTRDVRERGDALVLTGAPDPEVTWTLAPALPAGRHVLTVSARRASTVPEWAQRLLLGARGAELAAAGAGSGRLVDARLDALAGLPIGVADAANADAAAAAHRLGARRSGDAASFDATLALPRPAGPWFVMLGPGAHVEWRFETIELLDASGTVLASLPAAPSATTDLRAAAGWLQTIGERPSLRIDAPAAAGASSLRLRGRVR